MPTANDPAELFRHVSAEKAGFYRCIMNVFAAAKRQYRLQLRPDEVLAEARWPEAPPRIEEVNAALSQLADWGNLQSQPDTARVSTLSDFYRAKFLYRLSLGGEAVETALAAFFQTLQHRSDAIARLVQALTPPKPSATLTRWTMASPPQRSCWRLGAATNRRSEASVRPMIQATGPPTRRTTPRPATFPATPPTSARATSGRAPGCSSTSWHGRRCC